MFGILLLVPGPLALVVKEFRLQSPWPSAGFLAAYLLFNLLGISIWFLYRPVLNYIKALTTYPRTRYARPPDYFPDKRHPDYKILTLGTVSPQTITFPIRQSAPSRLICSRVSLMGFLQSTRWGLPLVMSGIAAGIYFINRNGVRPYSWGSALPMALAGILATPFDLKPEMRWFSPMFICGAWMLVIGTLTLVRYSRASQAKYRAGRPAVNSRIQDVAQLDRLVHEPARLMIMMILQGAGVA